MKREQDLILDFSHIYPEDIEKRISGLRRIDLRDVSGTDMYCTKEAADQIRKKLESFSPYGIHFLDSGNYHYITLFFAEKIKEPFSLILFDHHTDMQKPLFPHLLSCGSWAGELIHHDHYLKQLILVGPERQNVEGAEMDMREKIIWISREEADQKDSSKEIKKIDMSLPIYISIDKDVLSPSYARTNWNQGDMSLGILEKLLLEVFRHQQVIGVDICGECSIQEPWLQLAEDEKINQETNDNLYRFLKKLLAGR